MGRPATLPRLRHQNLTPARTHAAELIEVFIDYPVPEVARLGRTLATWRGEYLAYFDTNRASNGPTEAVDLRRVRRYLPKVIDALTR